MNASKQRSPAFSFIIMGVANFLAMIVFSLLYLIYTDAGKRYPLLLVAAGISLVSGVAMLVLYGYFQNRLDNARKNPSKETAPVEESKNEA